MSKTGIQLVANIKDNLGDRDWIGSRSFEDAALDAINESIYRISAKYFLKSLRKIFTGTIPSGSSQINFPTVDTNGIAFDTKVIEGLYVVEVGGTLAYPLKQITSSRKDMSFPLTSSSQTGRPQYFSVYSNMIDLYPMTSQDYIAYIRLATRPVAITINQTQPLGTGFDRVIEAGATSKIFRALQEPGDAAGWEQVYNTFLKEERIADEYSPDLIVDLAPRMVSGNPEYWLDPFSNKQN